MAIECYHKECKYHSVHTTPEDGPYCYEDRCFGPVIVKETHLDEAMSLLTEIQGMGYLEPGYESSSDHIAICKKWKELKSRLSWEDGEPLV